MSSGTPPVRRSIRKRRKPGTADESATASKKAKAELNPSVPSVAESILSASLHLRDGLDTLTFLAPTTHVYNPLHYAWDAYAWYTRRYGDSARDILLVGMNPGPWGMAQTGVPFGSGPAVREFLKMPAETSIGRPEHEHPKRAVEGLRCARVEVSGDRVWQQWARGTYGTAEAFFEGFFVYSYCPLLFLEASGRNRPANALRAAERSRMQEMCDEALREVVKAMRPRVVVGVGVWASERCRRALAEDARVECLLHPSPASPAANRGPWAEKARGVMRSLGRGGDGGGRG